MQGDKIHAKIDLGAGYTEDVTLEARSPGGNVTDDLAAPQGDGYVRVRELSKGGRVLQTLAVRAERLITLRDEPRR